MTDIRSHLASALVVLTLVVSSSAPLPAARQSGHTTNPERLTRIFEALGARPGAIIADIGAGGGDYTFKLADLVGTTGRVVAVDVSAGVVEKLRALVAWRKVNQITVVEGAVDDPRLEPGSLDAALIVNAYHEMVDYEAMLARIKAALKPGGRLVIVDQVSDSRRDATRAEQTDRHELAPAFAREDLRRAGFVEVSFVNDFTKRENQREWLIVASPRPAPASAAPQPATPAAVRASEADAAGLRIQPDQFVPLLESGRVIVLDTRTSESFALGRIPGARLAPMGALREHIAELAADGRLVVAYCQCPAEETSLRAVEYLRARGITNAKALVGGWDWWTASGRPIAR